MKITEIIIENYKSIKHMVIPMPDDYRENNTVFLLGINESGKSSILDAIYQLQTDFGDGDYYTLCHKSCQKQGEEIRVTACARLTEKEYSRCMDLLEEKLPVLREDIRKISGVEINKFVSLSNAGPRASSNTDVILDEVFPLEKYKHVGGTIALADSGAEPNIDIKSIKKIISDNIGDEAKFPTILSWKSSPEHLIMHEINLREFRENLDLAIPLKNIFSLYGRKDVSAVQTAIDWALGSGENKAELEEDLSHYATEYINSAWKGNQTNIKVKIDGESISVFVEDKDAVRTFLNVEQRSDGFKQFISLLLTLSAEHHGEILENNVLLLDEPEAHLHPSGAREMRDEIFKMGRSNQIFVATHSPVMVNIDTPQRHWIVKKEKLETHLQTMGVDASMKDEEVMRMAFGINVMKEILPDNLLLVEGKTDKQLFQFALNNLEERGDIPFITAAEGSKMTTLANMLDSHDINAVIFLDADGAGKKMQKTIIENRSSFDQNNVFVLGDLINDLPESATIEDLIPESCVKQCLRDNRKQSDFSVIPAGKKVRVLSKIQSTNPDLRDKREMSKIKLAMVERMIQDYSPDKRKEYARLFELAEALLKKFVANKS